ncbi:DUF3307 domain-containing protein [Actinomadura atramentaria]|uniref:DUF3307 domain-containing protein n=1 Tax=Actinomadura atramentaria TaxID=1990 RepID=UPI0012FC39D9|nr:DUF3307 domain-containing protein [Actinomadura atramentaria]
MTTATTHPVTYAVTLVTALVAHHVADHWIQTGTQAERKQDPGLAGTWAAARHVLTYTATLSAILALVAWRTGITYDPRRAALAALITAITHFIVDRGYSLKWIADHCGKGGFVRLGNRETAPAGTGAYALDQGWHLGWLLIATLILA